jgi:hypothetical protein
LGLLRTPVVLRLPHASDFARADVTRREIDGSNRS